MRTKELLEELLERDRALHVMLESPELTREEAKRLYDMKWWEFGGLKDDAALIQLRQSRLVMPFATFHERTEKLLGRSVWTHEFARPDLLLKELEGKREAPASPLHSLAEISPKTDPKNVVEIIVPEKEGGESR